MSKIESHLQISCIKLHRLIFPEDVTMIDAKPKPKVVSMLYSNYNNSIQGHGAAIGKLQGRSSGVADLTWICPDNRTIHIELKTEIGRQSKAQKEWQNMVEARGHTYHLVRSLEEFQALCEAERNKRGVK
jgi:hypothetical protein